MYYSKIVIRILSLQSKQVSENVRRYFCKNTKQSLLAISFGFRFSTDIPYIKMVINKREMEDASSMEIIKQLFDVASLFDGIGEDLSIVRNTSKIAPIELEYRKIAPDNLTAI